MAQAAGPAPGLVYGGFWIRFVAFLIDMIGIYVIYFIALMIAPVLALLVGLAALCYFPVCWAQLGQTVGMMPFGLRVVRADDGGKITWTNAILRLIGWMISGFCLYIGFIWAAFDPRKQGWHDKIGGTVVVKPA
jgi:uncharacterized RDD family membrane protein YckC